MTGGGRNDDAGIAGALACLPRPPLRRNEADPMTAKALYRTLSMSAAVLTCARITWTNRAGGPAALARCALRGGRRSLQRQGTVRRPPHPPTAEAPTPWQRPAGTAPGMHYGGRIGP